MERTLEAGLARIFDMPVPAAPALALPSRGGEEERPAPSPTPVPTPAGPELAAEARAAYDRALAAQRAGDWAKYGEEIRRLGEILGRMKSQ
jgi:uncharacterized membrane protein (UPF0182 family)